MKDGIEKVYMSSILSEDSGYLVEEIEWKNGIKEKERLFHGNGVMYKEKFYENGIIKKEEEYYPNGNIFSRSFYKDGKKDGIEYQYYYLTAEKIYRTTEYKNGQKNGVENYFADNNEITKKIIYENDEVVSKEYYEQGKLKKSKLYYENGQLSEVRNYKDNMLHGTFKKYATNGNIQEISTYQNGELIEQNIYNKFQNNELKIKKNINHEKQETITEYYEQGILAEEIKLKNNKIIESRKYYKNGQLEIERKIENGIEKTNHYLEDGSLFSSKNIKLREKRTREMSR